MNKIKRVAFTILSMSLYTSGILFGMKKHDKKEIPCTSSPFFRKKSKQHKRFKLLNIYSIGNLDKVAISENCSLIAKLGKKIITIYKLNKKIEKLKKYSNTKDVCSLLFFPYPDNSLMSIDEDKEFTIFNIKKRELTTQNNKLPVFFHKGVFNNTLISPDLKCMALEIKDDNNPSTFKIATYDILNEKMIEDIPLDIPLCCVAFPLDFNYVATLGKYNTVIIFYFSKDKIVHSYKNESFVTFISFSLDGRYVASGEYKGKVKIFDVQKGAIVYEYKHNTAIKNISFSKENDFLLSVSTDGDIKKIGIS